MKKLFSIIKKNLIPISFLLVLSLAFSACEKVDNNQTETPVAGLMAFNLVPDVEAVGVAIDGNVFTSVPLYFTNYTGGYRGVYVGDRSLQSFDFNSRESLATSSQLFKDSTYYSLFVIGTEGNYKNVLVEDRLDSLPTATGESFVRYINGIVDSVDAPNVKITANGTDLFNSSAAFGYVSDFKGVIPGDISITASNESAIDTSRTITVEAGKIYTILLTGNPAATDTSRAVSIKYITNGEIGE